MFRVFSAVTDIVSLIRGSFSKICPSDLGKAQEVPWVSCTSQACREGTFHVPIVVPTLGSLMVLIYRPTLDPRVLPWGARSLLVRGLDRSGMLFSLLCFYHVLSMGLGKAWLGPSPLHVSQNW